MNRYLGTDTVLFHMIRKVRSGSTTFTQIKPNSKFISNLPISNVVEDGDAHRYLELLAAAHLSPTPRYFIIVWV